MCGKKKGNRRRTTLSLLNADAKALCLRPDPELVKVFGIPRRVESCPSAAADEDLRSPPPARRRARGGVAKNTPAFATLRRRKTRRVVIGSSLNCWIKIAPDRYTRPIPVTRGMLEGGSGSPGKFTIQCAGLARAVRELGCGVTSPAGIISGLLHMDDLGQVVCDEADLRRALARVCSWLYAPRLASVLHAAARCRSSQQLPHS